MVEAKERQNLATALHDTVAQTLAAAKMRVESLKETIRVDGLETMEEARILLNKSIQQTRSIMAELSPPVLFEIGFIPALESLAEQITNLYGISVEVYSENDLSLARETQVLLYQSTRELLLNVAKHANAKKAEVTVSGANGVARIEVSDDGIGLDMSKVGYREDLSGGFGLFNIRERFAHFGGQLAIQSSKGEGTKVVLIIPAQGGMAALKGKIGHEH
jgi:signal transduction histidine kinase